MQAFPSPNFGERRGGLRPSIIVIHYTAMQSCAAARQRLCSAEAEVSAHWLIDRSGAMEQLVDERARAWHAGAGSWQGQGDMNSCSIGIELDNSGKYPFPEPQMQALERLLGQIMARWQIPAAGVIGHSDMAPERKIDPGAKFDWQRLARQGLAVWSQAAEAPLATDPERFWLDLQRIGYPPLPLEVLLPAFRLRFRPGLWAGLDGQDMALAADLALRFGVDAPQDKP